jgi:hypothetical protein
MVTSLEPSLLVAASDYCYPVSEAYVFAKGHGAQEWHAVEHTFGIILAGDAEFLRLVGPDGQEYRRESFVEQLVDVPNGVIQLEFHAQAQNLIDLKIEYVVRQAVLGDAHPSHAPGNRQGLKDGDLVSHPRQEVACRQPRRASTYHCHPSSIFGRQFGRRLGVRAQLSIAGRPSLASPLVINSVRYESFQRANGDRAVQLAPVAFSFAGVVAHATHCGREGIILLDYL